MNRNIILFFCIFIMLNTELFGQQGTIVFADIAPQGQLIVLGADTRALFVFAKDTSHPIAYMDSTCKIFQIKQFLVGIAGTSNIGRTYISEIIKGFNRSEFYSLDLADVLKSFGKYLEKKYPPSEFPEIKTLQLIGVGYVSNKPEIVGLEQIGTNYENFVVMRSGSTANDPSFIKYVDEQVANGGSPYSILERAIRAYAMEKDRKYYIGGPVSIVTIHPDNTIHWIQNDFTKRTFTSIAEFIDLLNRGKIALTYLVPNGKEKIIKYLRQ